MKSSLFLKMSVLFGLLFSPLLVSAGLEHNMSGFAWSSNVGWISFNCLDTLGCDSYAPGPGEQGLFPYHIDSNGNWRIDFSEYTTAISYYNSGLMTKDDFDLLDSLYQYSSGGVRTGEYHSIVDGADYGVNLDEEGDGSLVGYAWSPNIGWIKFGGFASSDFPTGGGTQKQNATLEGVNLKGWAKAIGAEGGGSGWDGWLSLSGAGYSVDLGDDRFTGYAWGSDVLGWILFDSQSMGVCEDCGVKLNDTFVLGSVGFDIKNEIGESMAGLTDVPHGTIPTFEWTLDNLPDVSCTLYQTSGSGVSFDPAVVMADGLTESGSMMGEPLAPEGTYGYRLSCSDPNTSIDIGLTVAAEPPGFTLTLGDMEIVRIQFLSSGPAESEQKTFFVAKQGDFSEEVMVSVDPSSLYCDISTTAVFKYSLNYSEYMDDPPSVPFSSPYTGGSTFRTKVSKKIDAPCYVDIVGTAAGYPEVRKTFVISPTTFDPVYEEF